MGDDVDVEAAVSASPLRFAIPRPPVLVAAVRFDGTNARWICLWVPGARLDGAGIAVPALASRLEVGDWITRDHRGAFEVVPAAEFGRRFVVEPVRTASETPPRRAS